MSPAGPGTVRSVVATPGGTVPSSQLVTALDGTPRAWTAMSCGSLIVATGAMRLVAQPQARSRTSSFAILCVSFRPAAGQTTTDHQTSVLVRTNLSYI